jgi:hypothetical protein
MLLEKLRTELLHVLKFSTMGHPKHKRAENVNISMPLIVVGSRSRTCNFTISSLRNNNPGLLQIVASVALRRVVPRRIGCSLHDDGSRSPSSRGHQMTSPVTIATEPNDAHPKLRPHYRRTVPRFAATASPGSSAHNFL